MTGPDLDAPALDLPQYLERVAVPESRLRPDAVTLRLLHRAHRLAIPFENLDILRGRPVSLALSDIQDKLVRGRRGGYCYEQNLLFAAVLRHLGFQVSGLMGRTRLGSHTVRPRTHMLLQVAVGGEEWLADVGCGSFGPLDPLRLVPDEVTTQDGWVYQIASQGTDLALSVRRECSWYDLYSFTRDEHHLVDYIAANHFNSTHPDSAFTRQLIVQRPGLKSRIALRGTLLTENWPDGRTAETEVLDSDQLREVLTGRFGLNVEFMPASPAFPAGTGRT